jgi:hypothetical protein
MGDWIALVITNTNLSLSDSETDSVVRMTGFRVARAADGRYNGRLPTEAI